MTAQATRLILRPEASEPIRGRIDTEDGAEGCEFFGWLGLAAAPGDLIAPPAAEPPVAAGTRGKRKRG